MNRGGECIFVGFLRNVDDSILGIKLENGYKFSCLEEQEGLEFIQSMEGTPDHPYTLLIWGKLLNHNTKRIYYCEKTIEMTDLISGVGKLQKETSDYIFPLIPMLRLFNGGNIFFENYYFLRKGGTSGIRQTPIKIGQNFPLFHCDSKELNELYFFIQNTKVPFKENYLQLAFDNFNLSFETDNKNLSYLAVMTGLEALFNPGDTSKITDKLANNCAVCLSKKDKQKSKEIYELMKKSYDLRSRLVHGNPLNISEEEITAARTLLCDSIKEIYTLNLPKEALLNNFENA